jgi:MscS family membrane protein
MSLPRYFVAYLMLATCSVFSPCVRAQIPGITTSSTPAASAPQNATPPDPLKRETPRGAILGFIKAAGEERYPVAIQYFQPATNRHRPSMEDEEEFAEQLFAILSRKFLNTFDFISNEPNGRLDDGLPADQEGIGNTTGSNEDFAIYLVRVEDEQGRKLWYISRKTLDQVPQVYDTLQYPQIEKSIPKPLVAHRYLAMPAWQWLALLLILPVAWFLARIFTYVSHLALLQWSKYQGNILPPAQRFFSLDPVTLAITILIHFGFVGYIGTSILFRLYYRPIVLVVLAVMFYWILTGITRMISRRIAMSLVSRGMYAERTIVSLVRRFVEVVIFLFVVLMVLKNLGVDVSTALAGVGIGGLALGLGAQKTFENVFGGVSILFDKVIVVGDICKINNQTGTVEDIGLRSTRLRTTERTILSIPNGVMATSTIENLRFRDKFLCQQIIRLRYDLAPDHVRYVVDELREILRSNPKVEESTARVRFVRFAEYALEVEIFAYILEPDYAVYLAVQEALLLQIMDALEKAGAVVALPSQTTLVTKDSWVDPEKAKAVQDAINKTRDPGVPGLDGNSKQ